MVRWCKDRELKRVENVEGREVLARITMVHYFEEINL